MKKSAENSAQNKPFYKTTAGATLLSAVILASVSIIVVLITPINDPVQQEDPETIQSVITSPQDNDGVTNPIRAEGTLTSYPEESFFWLAVQVGNLQWPKVEIRSTEFDWIKYVNETEKPGKQFVIVLLRVDSEGQRIIKNWFKKGDASGHYPGFEIVPNSETLDIVKVRFGN